MTTMGERCKTKTRVRRCHAEIRTFLDCKVEQPERHDERIENGKDEKNVNHEQMIRKPISETAA
jgi:hypothetical protein